MQSQAAFQRRSGAGTNSQQGQLPNAAAASPSGKGNQYYAQLMAAATPEQRNLYQACLAVWPDDDPSYSTFMKRVVALGVVVLPRGDPLLLGPLTVSNHTAGLIWGRDKHVVPMGAAADSPEAVNGRQRRLLDVLQADRHFKVAVRSGQGVGQHESMRVTLLHRLVLDTAAELATSAAAAAGSQQRQGQGAGGSGQQQRAGGGTSAAASGLPVSHPLGPGSDDAGSLHDPNEWVEGDGAEELSWLIMQAQGRWGGGGEGGDAGGDEAPRFLGQAHEEHDASGAQQSWTQVTRRGAAAATAADGGGATAATATAGADGACAAAESAAVPDAADEALRHAVMLTWPDSDPSYATFMKRAVALGFAYLPPHSQLWLGPSTVSMHTVGLFWERGRQQESMGAAAGSPEATGQQTPPKLVEVLRGDPRFVVAPRPGVPHGRPDHLYVRLVRKMVIARGKYVDKYAVLAQLEEEAAGGGTGAAAGSSCGSRGSSVLEAAAAAAWPDGDDVASLMKTAVATAIARITEPGKPPPAVAMSGFCSTAWARVKPSWVPSVGGQLTAVLESDPCFEVRIKPVPGAGHVERSVRLKVGRLMAVAAAVQQRLAAVAAAAARPPGAAGDASTGRSYAAAAAPAAAAAAPWPAVGQRAAADDPLVHVFPGYRMAAAAEPAPAAVAWPPPAPAPARPAAAAAAAATSVRPAAPASAAAHAQLQQPQPAVAPGAAHPRVLLPAASAAPRVMLPPAMLRPGPTPTVAPAAAQALTAPTARVAPAKPAVAAVPATVPAAAAPAPRASYMPLVIQHLAAAAAANRAAAPAVAPAVAPAAMLTPAAPVAVPAAAGGAWPMHQGLGHQPFATLVTPFPAPAAAPAPALAPPAATAATRAAARVAAPLAPAAAVAAAAPSPLTSLPPAPTATAGRWVTNLDAYNELLKRMGGSMGDDDLD